MNPDLKTAEFSRKDVRYIQDNFYGTSGKDRVRWRHGQGMGALQVAVYVVDDRTLILRSHILKHGPDIILRGLSRSEAQAKVNEFWPGLTPHNRWASLARLTEGRCHTCRSYVGDIGPDGICAACAAINSGELILCDCGWYNPASASECEECGTR